MKILSALSLAFASSFLVNAYAATPANATNSASFNPAQTQQIQKIVHDYLVSNPRVLVEASQALQQQAMNKMQQTASSAIEKNSQAIFNDAGSPVVGNPQGDITLVEFMDYQCGHCKAMGPTLDQLIQGDKNLRVVIKEFPIFGANSEYAAKAALAAQKQGKFLVFHNALLAVDSPLTQAEIMKIAQNVGLNTNQLAKDMQDPAIANQLKATLAMADALQLAGTPALILGNRSGSKAIFIPGETGKQSLQQAIQELRKS